MPKLLPKNNQVEQRWLDEARMLLPGQELFLQVEHKAEQTRRMKAMNELIAVLGRDEPETASRLSVNRLARDGKIWVHIRMLERSPLVGFIKNKDGSLEKVSVFLDPERRRRIKLMVSDGLLEEEMNAALDFPLSQSEKREFIEKGRFN